MSCTLCDSLQAGQWTRAMAQLADDLRGDPPIHLLEAHLLGRHCLLLHPFAQRDGDPADWIDLAGRLRHPDAVRGLLHYYAPAQRPSAAREQARRLLDALLEAHRAAVAALDSRAREDDFVLPARIAAEKFHFAWPGTPSVNLRVWEVAQAGIYGVRLTRLLRALGARVPLYPVGHLALRRVILHLLGLEEAEPDGRASTPALLYDPVDRRSIVARLSARRCLTGLPLYFPDPVTLALIAIDQRMLQSMRRAWDQTANYHDDQRDYALRLELDGPLAPRLEEESIGAALACAMRAAFARAALRDDAAISAALPPADGRLLPVGGLDAKLAAAARHDLHRVILAPPDAAAHQPWARAHGIDLRPAECLETAWSLLRDDSAAPVALADRPRLQPAGLLTRVAGFELLREIGHGSHRTVYEALSNSGERIALGLSPVLDELQALRLAEAYRRLGQTLAHPSLAPILDVRVDDGHLCVAYPLYPGRALSDRMARRPGPWPAAEVLALLSPIAEALDFAHWHGEAHGQLLPDDILFADDGSPRLLDVGRIAILQRAGLRCIPLAAADRYRAPEQWAAPAAEPMPSADNWALAIIAVELLTGRHPFEGAVSLGWQRAMAQPLSTDTPAPFRRALHPDPAQRFASALEMVRALANQRSGE